MADDPMATLAGWRKIEQAATPGSWQAVTGIWAADDGQEETFPAVITSHGDPAKAETWLMAAGRGSVDPEANAEFTAMARTAMPLLIAAVEAVLAEADRLDSGRGDYGHLVNRHETAAAFREAITRELAKGEPR